MITLNMVIAALTTDYRTPYITVGYDINFKRPQAFMWLSNTIAYFI